MTDAAAMKAAAEQMKSLKPGDLDKMVKEMEEMNPFQKSALKAIGMDPDAMMSTMKMMKDNPGMIENAQKLMENMTPEQMMEQSRLAQQQMKKMTPEQIQQANAAMATLPKEALDQAVEVMAKQPVATPGVVDAEIEQDDDNTEKPPMVTGPGSSSDPKVIDAMFEVAQFMSDPEKSGVTLSGFASLPVIQLLSGTRETDLSVAELRECWADGSLGASRVDRAGFGRVWKEVQDYFEDDIMGEARKEVKQQVSTKKKRRGGATKTSSSPVVSSTTPATKIGGNMSKEQIDAVSEMAKNMNDDDISQVLDAMANPDPAQEARLKAMGVDASMMANTASMLKSNPMMRDAAKKMMTNMSSEEMLNMSQQAQEQMKNMTPEQTQQVVKELEKESGKSDNK